MVYHQHDAFYTLTVEGW